MSGRILQMVARRRQVEADREAFEARKDNIVAAAKGEKGDPGPVGPMPKHEWDGSKLRFEQSPGKFGKWTDLKGPKGDPGNGGVVVARSGGSGFSPSDLPLLDSPPELTDCLVLERNGAAYRVTLSQLIEIFGGATPANAVTVNGEVIKANGEFVTVT